MEQSNADREGIEIQIDDSAFRVAAKPLTGADLRRLPNPPIGNDRDIFQMMSTGDTDIIIKDQQTIDFDNGARFFTAPQTINPGSKRSGQRVG